MKKLPRVLAIDDGFFRPRQKGRAILVGVVSRLDNRIEGILSGEVNVDGLDSTQKIISMLAKSKFKQQVSFLILDGVNFAGFNIVDVDRLFKRLSVPIIIVFRKMPRMEKIEKALGNFKDGKKRLKLIAKAGEIHSFNSIHFQVKGTDAKTAKSVLRKTIKYSKLPEPLRMAHLIASGVSIGESTRP
ncbi:MAG: DUF99 family protein [Candidatus Diapherotrites archaeon]|uniref:UPF0215 protein JW744_03215 n=1 Tax=Candidatus Iainarchaeum sp. TaxID=3101447 RepID=A0A938YXF2_9ARCH|nr:DUF99 family protein [Candidatus Diapherotrites archaeon]